MSHKFKPAKSPRRSHKKQRFLSWTFFVSAVVITLYGFFSETASLALAYLPFIGALITLRRTYRIALCGGHFAVLATLLGAVLISGGYSAVLVIPCALVLVALLSVGYGVFGVGLASVILLGTPYMMGNPLLMAGSVVPGLGVLGLMVVSGVVCGLALTDSSKVRALVLLLGLGAPASIFTWIANDHEGVRAKDQTRLNEFVEMPLVRTPDGEHAWALRVAMADIEHGSMVITGAGILKGGNQDETELLCRLAKVRDLQVLVGVLGRDGYDTVRLMAGASCLSMPLVYKAKIRSAHRYDPLGGEGQNNSDPSGLEPGFLDGLGFLTGLEVFSMKRWLGLRALGVRSVAVVSKDSWAGVYKPETLRRKVSAQFGKLFGMRVAHSNAGVGGSVLVKAPRP